MPLVIQNYFCFSLWKLAVPPVDADVGVHRTEDENAKTSIESNAEDSDDDSATDVDSKKKPKKEKIGFRDRKV